MELHMKPADGLDAKIQVGLGCSVEDSKFRTFVVTGITIVIWLVFNVSAIAQEAFLRKGTTALNPDDGRTLFLYIPGYTLLYELGQTKSIRSRRFGNREDYQFAVTQDGIRVLVRAADIRKNVKVLKKYDFLVNRRMPLCETAEACRNIWNDFTTVRDEGLRWSALWPRTAGKFTAKEEGDSRAVSVSIGGTLESGFIPSKRDQMRLEDSGFISLLNRQYPRYSFTETTNQELASPCTHERSTRKVVSLLEKVETYAKASANAKFDVAEGLSKSIPKNFARAVLSFLGLEANISAEAFVDGKWKKETNKETKDSITYGNKDEEWQVNVVEISRRSDEGSMTYQPFGSAMIRKVLNCQSGQPTEMTFTSYFLVLFPEREGETLTFETINVNAETIKNLKLANNRLDKGLVSINTQTSHYLLLDFLMSYNVPKSIANFFIKEINVAEPRR